MPARRLHSPACQSSCAVVCAARLCISRVVMSRSRSASSAASAIGPDMMIDPPSQQRRRGSSDADEQQADMDDEPAPRSSTAAARKNSFSATDAAISSAHVGVEMAASGAASSSSSAHAPIALRPAAGSDAMAHGGDLVDSDDEDYIRVASFEGYSFSWRLEAMYFAVALCTGFLSCLAAHWFPLVAARWRYRRESDLRQAEYALVEAVDGGAELLPVERVGPHPLAYEPRVMGTIWRGPRHLSEPDTHPATYVPLAERMVVFRHHRFVMDPESGTFIKQREPLQEAAGVLAERLERGLDGKEQRARQRNFGLNQLTIVVPSYPALLLGELFHPFFIFQIYSVILWCFEAYYIFALCIAVIATVSIVTTLLETRSRLSNLAALAKCDVEVTVLRNDGPGSPARAVRVSSSELVAGDVVEVCVGVASCDLALLSGGAVLNEAMLTGEAIPVLKVPVQLPLDPRGSGARTLVPLGIESRSTIYAATKVMQLKPSQPGGRVWGMVVRTGFATTKGALILSILYPRPSSFGFVQQSYKFIGALFVMALVGFAVAIWQLKIHGAEAKTMVIRGLDLITIVVPPSLPLALSVGTNFALLALKVRKIFCISPARINLAGKIQVMCFDKTGTLTAEGMELRGVLPVRAVAGGDGAAEPDFGPFVNVRAADLNEGNPESSTAPGRKVSSSDGVSVGAHSSNSGGDDSSARARGWSASALRGGSEDGAARQRLNDEHAGSESPTASSPYSGGSVPPSGHGVAALSPAMLTAMSCCHSLAVLDGALIGDPLEVEIFQSTGARISDAARDGYVSFVTLPMPAGSSSSAGQIVPPHGSSSSSSDAESLSLSSQLAHPEVAEWGVLTQFEFVPALQRMCVIVANQNDATDVRVLCKGSPEVLRSLCKAETIPPSYEKMLAHYAHRGYRIIAVGCKSVQGGRAGVPHMEKELLRQWCERDLHFLGLLVLENALKPETAPTLQILSQATIRNIMVTGDNPLTGLCVARECGLVPKSTRVFVAHVKTDPSSGKKDVEWVDTTEIDVSSIEAASDAGAHASGSQQLQPKQPQQPLKLNPRTLRFEGPLPPGCGHTFKYELALTGAAFKLLEERHFLAAASRGEVPGGNTERRYVKNDVPALGAGDEELGAAAGGGEDASRYFHRVILSALVFARMAPEDKASLVSHLQSLGLYVGFCGDGANDVGALKAGHVGVSLSDSEASIAAPFTYARPNISCIPILLSEGRSSLMTSFQLFKYMAMYSMIQFTAVIMLYFRGSVFGNWEYLFQDMFLVFPLTVFMGATRSTPSLSRKRPSGNLLSIINVACLGGHMLICLCFQILVFSVAKNQSDYVSYPNDQDGSGACVAQGPCTYESTSVYFYSNFQLLCMAVLLARGSPWKAAVWSNKRFTTWAILCLAACLALLFSQHQGSFFREEEVPIGIGWRGAMFGLALLDAFCNAVFHGLLFPVWVQWVKKYRARGVRKEPCYGKTKPIEGPRSKLWHRLRGEFEAGWRRE